jgi:O-antigen/teichoic acid export membrane protein
MEKRVLTATLISASVNVIGNFILIPFFKQDAAAITTVAAELISALICGYTARKLVNISIPLRDFVSVVFGSLAVYFICTKLLVRFHEGIGLTVPVMGAAAAYAVILLLAGNTAVTTCLDYLKEKITGTIYRN